MAIGNKRCPHSIDHLRCYCVLCGVSERRLAAIQPKKEAVATYQKLLHSETEQVRFDMYSFWLESGAKGKAPTYELAKALVDQRNIL